MPSRCISAVVAGPTPWNLPTGSSRRRPVPCPAYHGTATGAPHSVIFKTGLPDRFRNAQRSWGARDGQDRVSGFEMPPIDARSGSGRNGRPRCRSSKARRRGSRTEGVWLIAVSFSVSSRGKSSPLGFSAELAAEMQSHSSRRLWKVRRSTGLVGYAMARVTPSGVSTMGRTKASSRGCGYIRPW